VTLLSFGGGWLAEEAVKRCANRVVAMLTARMVVVAVEAGGATASGAVAGGAVGTCAEPGGGTMIGLVLGMGAGFGVDWWMESRLKEKTTQESRRCSSGCARNFGRIPEAGWLFA